MATWRLRSIHYIPIFSCCYLDNESWYVTNKNPVLQILLQTEHSWVNIGFVLPQVSSCLKITFSSSQIAAHWTYPLFSIILFYMNKISAYYYSSSLFFPFSCSHPGSTYRIWNNGQILMFKVSKRPYRSPRHDRIICKWRHCPLGGQKWN